MRNEIVKAVGLRKYKRVIDLGCGESRLAEGLAIVAKEVHTLDIKLPSDPIGIFKRYNLNRPLPYPDNHFDLIILKQTINHIDNFDLLLSEILRILEPNGVFILTSENLSGFHNILALLLGRMPFGYFPSRKFVMGVHPKQNQTDIELLQSPHVNCFTLIDMKNHMQKHGFKIIEARGIGYFGRYSRYYLIKCIKKKEL